MIFFKAYDVVFRSFQNNAIRYFREVYTHTYTHTHARARARAHIYTHIYIYFFFIYDPCSVIQLFLSMNVKTIRHSERIKKYFSMGGPMIAFHECFTRPQFMGTCA